jgi:ubiquinone/menaquinone biosynthesis C-methylase UbiE
MDIVKTYYEKESSDYDKEFYRGDSKYPTLKYRHNYILKRVNELNFPDHAKVLDIGCGPGEMVLDLMKNNWEIWGIDIAENMIAIAKKKIEQIKDKSNIIHLEVGDIEKLAFEDNFFDLIICAGVIEYLADDEKWSKEITRVLRPGGILLINITNKYAIRRWTASIIEKLKNSRLLFNLMNFTKQKILRKGKLHHFPFKPRLHSPKGFDHFLASLGFKKLSHNYFDFTLLPAPFDTLLRFITIPIRKSMEKYTEKNMKFTGAGYIVCVKLKEKNYKY